MCHEIKLFCKRRKVLKCISVEWYWTQNFNVVKIFLIWLNFPFSRVLEQALEEQALPRLHLVLVGVSLSFKNRADFFSFLWFIFIDYGKSKNRNNFFFIIAFFLWIKSPTDKSPSSPAATAGYIQLGEHCIGCDSATDIWRWKGCHNSQMESATGCMGHRERNIQSTRKCWIHSR